MGLKDSNAWGLPTSSYPASLEKWISRGITYALSLPPK
jgi:hypothetical protein